MPLGTAGAISGYHRAVSPERHRHYPDAASALPVLGPFLRVRGRQRRGPFFETGGQAEPLTIMSAIASVVAGQLEVVGRGRPL
jgi:hypothetical protein